MNLLIEINHPAHIHLYRNLAVILVKKGHKVIWLIKKDRVINSLCTFYGISGIVMGAKGNKIWQKYLYQIRFVLKTILIRRKQKASLGLGVSMTLPLVSKFTAMHSICMDDDDMAVTPVFAKYANKANIILTPSPLDHEKRGINHLTYQGYHELAYLHPNNFTPDPEVLKKLGLAHGERFFILRFNAFRAHHDIRQSGIGAQEKSKLMNHLAKYGKVFISTEDPTLDIPGNLAGKIEPWEVHSLIYYADLFIGDSQTMTTEAAVLGTPALKCNTFAGRLSIPNELELKYGLCYSYHPKDFDKMLAKIDNLLSMPDLKSEWQLRRKKLLSEKIDVTAFLTWFIENYPESVKTMMKEPGFTQQFK